MRYKKALLYHVHHVIAIYNLEIVLLYHKVLEEVY